MVQETWNVNKSEASKRAGNFGKAEETMAKTGAILPKSRKGKNLTAAEDEQQVDALAAAALGKERDDPEKRKEKKRRSGRSRILSNLSAIQRRSCSIRSIC